MSNQLELYTDDKERLTINSKQFEKQFRKLWGFYVHELNKLRGEYKESGASDTVSKEAQIKWLQKRVNATENELM